MSLHIADLTSCVQKQSLKLGERAGKLMNIKMNKLTAVVENQSAELSRLRKRLTIESHEDTQMLHDMKEIHESAINLKRRATIYEANADYPEVELPDSTTPHESELNHADVLSLKAKPPLKPQRISSGL